MDMKDDEGTSVALGLRAHDAGHEVCYWTQSVCAAGRGMFDRYYGDGWKKAIEHADVTVLSGNCDYPKGLTDCMQKGYTIVGANPKAAALELDRAVGQQVLEKFGIETIPYTVVKSAAEAKAHILKTQKPYVMKPWGGLSNKAMTFVAKTPDDAIFVLEKWEREGLFKGELMLQERVSGIEVGISAFFGPGGWSMAKEESFEHKKLMNDELGPNTGEMGTVIRHTPNSRLFDLLLEPLTDYLHSLKYVGDVSVNCIVDDQGRPWPLELTIRFGWPDLNIRLEVLDTDPVEWLYDLYHGQDTFVVRPDIAIGVVMVHGDFPFNQQDESLATGYPITGIDEDTYSHVQFQQVMDGPATRLFNGKLQEIRTWCTAGNYVCVATGRGTRLQEAQERAYEVAWKVRWPSNVMFRTDIGQRLYTDIGMLQQWGYCEGMNI